MVSDSTESPRLVVIAGPTGVGKSALALELAESMNGEIISADSMQVYRYMDIGTAKPDREVQLKIGHHLIDVVDPDEEFNAALFARKADTSIHDIMKRERHVFVVGGTGLYLRALLRGLFDAPPGSRDLRASYRHDEAARGGCLYAELCRRDADTARRLHPHDSARIIRALEILDLTGETMSHKERAHGFGTKRYEYIFIGLAMERSMLYERIDDRVDEMIAKGLIEETEGLLARGYDETLKPMQSMTYRHMAAYLKGSVARDDAVALIRRDTRRYAKRQMTWFRNEDDIVWMQARHRDAVYEAVKGYLNL